MASAKGSHRNLIVWQKAMDLVDAVYDLTEQYPREHLYGLTAHTQKTAVSIPSNIAEGRRRGSDDDFHRFLVYLDQMQNWRLRLKSEREDHLEKNLISQKLIHF